jgi:hypothetical protein
MKASCSLLGFHRVKSGNLAKGGAIWFLFLTRIREALPFAWSLSAGSRI